MAGRSSPPGVHISVLIWCAMLACGCSTLRLPAIDPTGEQIFLPPPSYTTLETPAVTCPEPAFSQPPAVPPCDELGASASCPSVCPPVVCPPAATAPVVPPAAVLPPASTIALPAGVQDRLILTPSRIVAPVGSEVVLLAGLCGSQGRYLTHQPIEWTLSQESVGHLVDVGEVHHHHLSRLLHRSPRKLSNNFALTRTSARARMITRGTPAADDDVWLQKGQTWITVTSPTEGISHVSAVATAAENWDQRRQTATIHWVDAQWVLPAPRVVRAGESAQLTTRVTRGSSGRPLDDWIVRYEVAGGAPAYLDQPGQRVVEVPTDASGQATVQLVPETQQAGSTNVRIQILAPGDGNPIVVGEGQTSVTWSAPGLVLRATGPDSAATEANVLYRIEVENPGDLPTTNVVVEASLPESLSYVSSNPEAEQFGNRIQWKLGDLAPQESRTLELTCRTLFEGDLRLRIEATGDGLSSTATVTTRVIGPSLEVRVVEAPTTARLGERIQFNIEVENVGAFRLTNVVVRDSFDPGLEHTYGESSPIERTVGDDGNLEPGEVSRFAVSFFVRGTGRLCHTVEAVADGGQADAKRVCVEVAEPRRDLAVEIRGPEQSQVGQRVEFEIRVTNTGEGPLSEVEISYQPDPSLVSRNASRNFRQTEAGLLWTIPSLLPDETQVRRVLCECAEEDPRAQSLVTVSTAEEVTARDAVITTIAAPREPEESRPAPREPPPEDAAPGAAAEGELRVSVADSANPIRVGQSTIYFIELDNDRDVPDKNVTVTFEVPEGLEFAKFRSDSISLQVNTRDDRTYEVDQINEIRPNRVRRLQVEVVAREPGDQRFRLTVNSLRTSEPIVAEKVTRVYAE